MKTEGVNVTSGEAKKLIDTFFSTFPRTQDFIKEAHRQVRENGFVENAYGRRRCFHRTSDENIRKGQEREGQNTPIQGTVAEALSIALDNVYRYRNVKNMKFKIVLPVHDAIFLDTPIDEIDAVTNEVMPLCMSQGVVVPGTNLRLGIDIEIMSRWGEKVSKEEAIEIAREELRLVA